MTHNPHERLLSISGIMVPVTTPFGSDGRLATDRLQDNIAKWESVEVDGETTTGYVVCASTGEAPLLTADERISMIRAAREATPKGKLLMVGSGAESTQGTVARTREAADLGAECALVITPSYYRAAMTEDVLAKFYLDVAEASPIPIVLYNVPAFTGVEVGESVARHLKAHPNIIGIKDSSGNVTQVSQIVYNAPSDFHTLVGNMPILFAALCLGAHGGIIALANVAPQIPLGILALHRAGRLDEARELQHKAMALARAVPSRYGVAGLKAAMDLQGYYGGPPRPPLVPAPPATLHVLRALLEQSGLAGPQR